MSVDFRRLTSDLHAVASALKARCIEAEAREADLRRQLEEEQAECQRLEKELGDVTSRYKSLQAGLNGTADKETIRQQRDRYLEMVRVIDDCISKLERATWKTR